MAEAPLMCAVSFIGHLEANGSSLMCPIHFQRSSRPLSPSV
jgi:hypothetical protein